MRLGEPAQKAIENASKEQLHITGHSIVLKQNGEDSKRILPMNILGDNTQRGAASDSEDSMGGKQGKKRKKDTRQSTESSKMQDNKKHKKETFITVQARYCHTDGYGRRAT